MVKVRTKPPVLEGVECKYTLGSSWLGSSGLFVLDHAFGDPVSPPNMQALKMNGNIGGGLGAQDQLR